MNIIILDLDEESVYTAIGEVTNFLNKHNDPGLVPIEKICPVSQLLRKQGFNCSDVSCTGVTINRRSYRISRNGRLAIKDFDHWVYGREGVEVVLPHIGKTIHFIEVED